jgi:hypothetical protein
MIILDKYDIKNDSGSLLTVEVAILVALHAANVFAIIEVVCVEHLFDRLNPLCEKATDSVVFSLAFLAETTATCGTFIDHVAPLVTLVADCTLRAALTGMA